MSIPSFSRRFDVGLATAITLLALEVRFPEMEAGVVAQQFPSLLAAALPSILAFVFGFAFIGVYWVAHPPDVSL